MASELTVQTLRGPTSGANADTILIPSGQTLDASAATLVPNAGYVVQHQYVRRISDISTSTGGTWVNVNNISFTPLYANSLLELSLNFSLGTNQQDIRWRFVDTTASYQIERTGIHRDPGVNTDASPSRHTFMTYYSPGNTNTRTLSVEGMNETGSGIVWFHTYGSQTSSFFVIKEIKQ
jgi:hypothetical protein